MLQNKELYRKTFKLEYIIINLYLGRKKNER